MLYKLDFKNSFLHFLPGLKLSPELFPVDFHLLSMKGMAGGEGRGCGAFPAPELCCSCDFCVSGTITLGIFPTGLGVGSQQQLVFHNVLLPVVTTAPCSQWLLSAGLCLRE